jgi:hypothetical protein
MHSAVPGMEQRRSSVGDERQYQPRASGPQVYGRCVEHQRSHESARRELPAVGLTYRIGVLPLTRRIFADHSSRGAPLRTRELRKILFAQIRFTQQLVISGVALERLVARLAIGDVCEQVVHVDGALEKADSPIDLVAARIEFT